MAFRIRELWSFDCISGGGRVDAYQAGCLCVGNIDNLTDKSSIHDLIYCLDSLSN